MRAISSQPNQNVDTKNEEIYEKNIRFRNEIRDRQKDALFKTIRKQYHHVHHVEKQKNTNGEGRKQSAEMHEQFFEDYPLYSATLEKFHHLTHPQISAHLEQISHHLMEFNIYLSQFQRQSQSQMDQSGLQDQQSLLVNDLFYLSLEHQGRFKFPRKFKFLRNGSSLVASYVSIVSAQISPEELAYWIEFMGEEDRNIIYLNVMGEEEDINMNSQHAKSHLMRNFHYQSWVNHPILRNYLLRDLPQIESAAKAVRQIVGFRRVHPDRLKNSKGQSLYEILCQMLEDELEGMIEMSERNGSNLPKCKLISPHLEICVKVIQAKYLSDEDPGQLHELVSRVLTNRVQSNQLQISALFCTWVIEALLVHNLRVVSRAGYHIIVSLLEYEPQTFTTDNKMSTTKIKKQKVQAFFERVKEDNEEEAGHKFEASQSDDNSASWEREEKMGHKMDEEGI